MSHQRRKPWEIDRWLRSHGFVIFKRPARGQPIWILTANNIYVPNPPNYQKYTHLEAIALVRDLQARDSSE